MVAVVEDESRLYGEYVRVVLLGGNIVWDYEGVQ
jgi:hypothetical protein